MKSGQNTSHAVMAQRAEAHDSLEDFPTPPWAARALVRHVILPRVSGHEGASILRFQSLWEPACNRGYLVAGLRDSFGRVMASDIHDYGWPGQQAVADFLFPGSDRRLDALGEDGADWIITNPPFRLAAQFIARACEIAHDGVAMLVRTAFVEGAGRYETLFRPNPPSVVAQFVERVPMVKGRLDPAASTATAYCWLVWMRGEAATAFQWIPPCRRDLERPGDYPKPQRAAGAPGALL